MPSTVAADHPELVSRADEVCAELRGFARRLDRFDDGDHEQHRVYLARAERLEGHLRGALALTRGGLHASALVLVRVALEHHLADRLLHVGRRYAGYVGHT